MLFIHLSLESCSTDSKIDTSSIQQLFLSSCYGPGAIGKTKNVSQGSCHQNTQFPLLSLTSSENSRSDLHTLIS